MTVRFAGELPAFPGSTSGWQAEARMRSYLTGPLDQVWKGPAADVGYFLPWVEEAARGRSWIAALNGW